MFQRGMKAAEAAGATHYDEIEEDDVRRALELSLRDEAERQERNRIEEERRLLLQSGMGKIQDAAGKGELEVMKSLLAAGVNIDEKDRVS